MPIRSLHARLSAAAATPSVFFASLFVGGVALALAACDPAFDQSHGASARGTLGQEVYTVMCDRVGAGELREDLTGSSFRGICHDDGNGFADEVDETTLPPLDGDATDQGGNPVTLDQQKLDRERHVKRIEVFAQKRDDIIHAIDAIIPDSDISVHDLWTDAEKKTEKDDPKDSCVVADEKGSLHTELATLLGNFGKLYDDGTIPGTTQALARTLATFRDAPDARAAWARLSTRDGYRPPSVALGLIRPLAAYPNLRDLMGQLIGSISADSRPYEQIKGRHFATPGPSYLRLLKLLEVASHEFDNGTLDPAPAPLVTTHDDAAGLVHLSRPRANLELAQSLMLAQDDAFGGGAPAWIVRRDGRGLAQVAREQGKLPALFADADGDGLPDLDADGRFVTTDGAPAPTPFLVPGAQDGTPRDNFTRAEPSGALLYDYVDTSRTFTASALKDALPLFNPEPSAQHETAMDALAGLYVVAGQRDTNFGTTKQYADGTSVQYDGLKRDESPLLDLAYAGMQLVAEPSVDDTLALTKQLVQNDEADLARVLKAVLDARELADHHDEAKIPKTSTLWDDLFENLGRTAQEPGLLEDIMDSLTNDDTALLGTLLSDWSTYKDQFSYNRNDLDGPAVNVTAAQNSDPSVKVDLAQPDSGDNRSMLQRFLQLMNDGSGVASCNRAGAQVKAHAFGLDVTLPFNGDTYRECAVYKVNDLDVFLLDVMVGDPKAQLYIRQGDLRNGQFAQIGQATVGLMEDSSNMHGFYTPRDSTELRPTAPWLARKVFFDLDEQGNDKTRDFIDSLDGAFTGSSICPERVIDDPCTDPSAGCDFGGAVPIPNDVDDDGKVHGLRSCQDGQWLAQRNRNTLFMMERVDGYKAFNPLAQAYVKHGREDLFIDLSIVLHKHWQTAQGTPDECITKDGPCAKSGASTYQPYLGELLVKDILPSVMNLVKTTKALSVPHCTSVGADGVCQASEPRDGISVLAEAARSMLDPNRAAAVGLKDRLGSTSTVKNDGSPVAQVTPAYLLTNALSAMDTAYDTYAAAHPDDAGRQAQFRRARSQLADQFLAIDGSGSTARLHDRGLVAVLPILIDLLRSQTWANCPQTFGDGTLRCNWARQDLPKKLEDVMTGPMFSAALELLDGMRRDDQVRYELQRVVQYLLDAGSQNDALPALLASSNDALQLLQDDKNLVPFFKVLGAALDPYPPAEGGNAPRSLVDSTFSLLGRVAGKYENLDDGGNVEEICSREIDPNQVMNVLLGTAVTPADSLGGKAPIEILLDVIADVNRVAPEEPKQNYDEADYAAIADTTVSFLTNRERGMEQFYEIVRKGQARQ